MKYTYKCMSFPGQNYPKLLATHSALLDKVCFISLVHHSCDRVQCGMGIIMRSLVDRKI